MGCHRRAVHRPHLRRAYRFVALRLHCWLSASQCSIRDDSSNYEQTGRPEVRAELVRLVPVYADRLRSVITELVIGYMLPGRPVAMMM